MLVMSDSLQVRRSLISTFSLNSFSPPQECTTVASTSSSCRRYHTPVTHIMAEQCGQTPQQDSGLVGLVWGVAEDQKATGFVHGLLSTLGFILGASSLGSFLGLLASCFC